MEDIPDPLTTKNTAEHAILTLNINFISGLSKTDKDFLSFGPPFRLGEHNPESDTHIKNQTMIIFHLKLNSQFNFNQMPLNPTGTKLCCMKNHHTVDHGIPIE